MQRAATYSQAVQGTTDKQNGNTAATSAKRPQGIQFWNLQRICVPGIVPPITTSVIYRATLVKKTRSSAITEIACDA